MAAAKSPIALQVYSNYVRRLVSGCTKPPREKRLRKPGDFRQFYLEMMQRRYPAHVLVDEGSPANDNRDSLCYPYHLQGMIDALLGYDGAEVVVAVPRRHSKTTTILACLVYIALTEKGTKSIYATYSDDLAKLAAKEFDAMIAAWGGPKKSGTANEKRVGTNTVFFMSLNGSVTGKGSNRLCAVDDPIKGQEQAESPAELDKVFANLESAVFSGVENTRVNKVVCGTRWAKEDPQGRLIDRGWQLIHYRAITEVANDNGTLEERALWPEVRSLAFLHKLRKSIGGASGYTWQSLMQGEPPGDSFKIFSATVHRHAELPADWRSKIVRSAAGIDLAYSSAKNADFKAYCVAHLVALTDDERVIVIERGGLEKCNTESFFENVKPFLPRAKGVPSCHWYGCAAELDRVEEIEQVYKVWIEGHDSFGKLGNAQNVSRLWNAGCVFVPDEWTTDDEQPLKQILGFTGHDGTHDDFVDAMASAVDDLTDRDYSDVNACIEQFFGLRMGAVA